MYGVKARIDRAKRIRSRTFKKQVPLREVHLFRQPFEYDGSVFIRVQDSIILEIRRQAYHKIWDLDLGTPIIVSEELTKSINHDLLQRPARYWLKGH